MSGTPLFQALVLFASVIAIIGVAARFLHPFLALTVAATVFGLAAGLSVAFVGKAFGAGLSLAVYSPGLVIVAAALVAALADATGASGHIAHLTARWRWAAVRGVVALVGLIAGVGARPAAAYAILTPLTRALYRGAPERSGRVSVTLALAISASHAVILFSPLPIAAAAILNAPWLRVVMFGLPLAVILAIVGALWASVTAIATPGAAPAAAPRSESGSAAALLLVSVAVPLGFLIFRSLGDLPSEPLGGGTAREAVIGVGRPLILLLAGVGIIVIGRIRQATRLFADSSWTSQVIGEAAGTVLIVGTAGGLQRLCQETGMAELLGERLSFIHVAAPLAIAIPLMVAATIKTLQGSSLVAAIAAAGMIEPLLAQLGLAGDSGRALATLAIGAGAMTVSHVNDEYFWLVAADGGLTPRRALLALGGGTFVQGVVALIALLVFALILIGN